MKGDIVVLFHGPDIFDKGYAKEIIELFPNAAFYQAGTMGRTAAHDNNIDNVISIPDLPSKVIKESVNIKILIIAIYPKNIESGKTFVRTIIDNSDVTFPILHIDCQNNVFVQWQGNVPKYIIGLLEENGFTIEGPIGSLKKFSIKGNQITRRLFNCSVGEKVLCNNILIGTANGDDVTITCEDGKIIGTTGISVKDHGIEKLEYFGKLDIMNAKCCSTKNLRDSYVKPRIVGTYKGQGVVFINHAASDVYELSRKCEGAVVVGDDTSRIVGDVLYRYNIPVLAITDGDWDMLIEHERFSIGSVLIEVENDDSIGNQISKEIFCENEYMELDFENIKKNILSFLEKKITNIRHF